MNAVANDITPIERALRDEPMHKHTSWRVGGPADLFFKPTSVPELQRVLAELPPATSVHWLG